MNAFLGSQQLIDNHDPYIAPYGYLAKNTMYEWFHPNGDLRENYKRCVELDTYFDKASLHCHILGIIPPLNIRFAMYLESNALAANHSPLLSSSP